MERKMQPSSKLIAAPLQSSSSSRIDATVLHSDSTIFATVIPMFQEFPTVSVTLCTAAVTTPTRYKVGVVDVKKPLLSYTLPSKPYCPGCAVSSKEYVCDNDFYLIHFGNKV